MNYLKAFQRELKVIIEGGDVNAAVDFPAEKILADITQMTSELVEIVPLSHRQGNCTPFAAIRWPDFR